MFGGGDEMENNIIQEIRIIVENACKSNNNKFGEGIWEHHILVVEKYALKLADEYNADKEIVILASLLHDYSGINNIAFYKEHHIHSAIAADMILSKMNYPSNRIERVKDAILSHRNSKNIEPSSPEGICLASADAMAHIKEVPSLLYMVYHEKNMDIEDGSTWVKEKITKSWTKVCKEGRLLIKDDYYSALTVLGA